MKKILFITLFTLFGFISKSQGDCPAQYVCVGGSFTAVTDATDELNASNNGCLAVNEGTTSYWFRICALTAGTIEFTIAPSGNNNDYDFAVWSGSTCPPTVMPIRCSFAASLAGPGADNTGVSSANNAPQTDNSENAFGNQWVQDINAAAGQCYIININNYGTGSNNFNLTFGGTATLDCTILPIELLSFEAILDKKQVKLFWSVSTQINNDHFFIERSNDAFSWEKIAEVDGAGTNNQYQEYSCFDKNPLLGTNYYRLSQTDFDGTTKHFNIEVIDYEKMEINVVKITNLMGQEVNEDFDGLRVIYYSDGTVIKKVGK